MAFQTRVSLLTLTTCGVCLASVTDPYFILFAGDAFIDSALFLAYLFILAVTFVQAIMAFVVLAFAWAVTVVVVIALVVD